MKKRKLTLDREVLTQNAEPTLEGGTTPHLIAESIALASELATCFDGSSVFSVTCGCTGTCHTICGQQTCQGGCGGISGQCPA
jgi:predicted RNA methylase